MKKYLLTLLLVLPSIAFSGDLNNFYITAKGGISSTANTGKTNYTDDGRNLVFGNNDLGDSATTLGLSVSKYIYDNFRIELEFVKRTNYDFSAPHATINNAKLEGDIDSSSFFVNGLYDFNAFALDNKTITPYIGVGIGLSRNRAEAISSVVNGEIVNTLNNHSTNELAYKFSAGMVMSMTQNMSLDINYQYSNLGDFESGVYYGSNSQLETPVNGGKIKAHELMLGLRFNY